MKPYRVSYRVSMWLDTSPESLAQEQARIFYGVQARVPDTPAWRHLHTEGEPCLFDTPEEASMFIDLLLLDDADSRPIRINSDRTEGR